MECKAMPRGSGKTTLCETACLWALLYGHREFVALIGSDEDHAADMLDSIKSELENNVLLAEDTGPAQSFDGLDSRGLDNLGIEGEHTTCRGARSAAGGAGGVAQDQQEATPPEVMAPLNVRTQERPPGPGMGPGDFWSRLAKELVKEAHERWEPASTSRATRGRKKRYRFSTLPHPPPHGPNRSCGVCEQGANGCEVRA